jgi:hypothetical protein
MPGDLVDVPYGVDLRPDFEEIVKDLPVGVVLRSQGLIEKDMNKQVWKCVLERPGNTKRGSIIVLLTSCLTGLD